jgi:hypothetical protein
MKEILDKQMASYWMKGGNKEQGKELATYF